MSEEHEVALDDSRSGSMVRYCRSFASPRALKILDMFGNRLVA